MQIDTTQTLKEFIRELLQWLLAERHTSATLTVGKGDGAQIDLEIRVKEVRNLGAPRPETPAAPDGATPL